jgi:DNA-directed RNA polymerase specialized sigma24 family protein
MSQTADSERNAQGAEADAATLDQFVAGLYGMASMLVGGGEDGVRVVEAAVATAEVSGSAAGEAERSSRRALARAAIELLAERAPGSLDAPHGEPGPHPCIEDDELDAAGMSGAELERMMAGPDRGRVRTWLESLPAEQRAIFVLRAVGAIPAAETAALLAAHGGPGAAGWTAEQVREVFRQALCSLASQLLHAANTR